MSITGVGKTQGQRSLVRLCLCSNNKGLMEIAYEPVQHALRVSLEGARRLFFYEPDSFFPSKGTLLNEYGLVLGKVHCKSRRSGSIHLAADRFQFDLQPENNSILLNGTALPEPVTCSFESSGPEQNASDGLLLRALAIVAAWWHLPKWL